MCDFKDAKVGDRVWSVLFGWGNIIELTEYFVLVDHNIPDVKKTTYFRDGRWSRYAEESINKVLFWDEVKIVPPPKPKRKVKKVIEGWANVWPWPVDTPCGASIGFLHSTVTGALKERGTHSLASGDPIFIRHEYEEFED